MKNILKIALLSVMMYSVGASGNLDLARSNKYLSPMSQDYLVHHGLPFCYTVRQGGTQEPYERINDKLKPIRELDDNGLKKFHEWPCKDAILEYERNQGLSKRVVFYHGAPTLTAIRQICFRAIYEKFYDINLPEYPLYNCRHNMEFDCTQDGGFLYVTPGLFTNAHALLNYNSLLRCPWWYVVHANQQKKAVDEYTISDIFSLNFYDVFGITDRLTPFNPELFKAYEELVAHMNTIIAKQDYGVLYTISMPIKRAMNTEYVFPASAKSHYGGTRKVRYPAKYESWIDIMRDRFSLYTKEYYLALGISCNIFSCPEVAQEYGVEVKQFGGEITQDDQEELKRLVHVFIDELDKKIGDKRRMREKFDKRYFKQQ